MTGGLITNEGAVLHDAEDLALRERFARSDADAFDRVVALYQWRVTRLAYRLLGWNDRDLEDVVQDVFLKAMSKADAFRGQSSLWTWLTAITLNCCRSRQRRASLWARWRLSDALTGLREGPRPDVATIEDDTAKHVRRAVATLPAKEREVIVLYYLEQRPTREICGLLGLGESAVQVRMHRGREKLKKKLSAFATE